MNKLQDSPIFQSIMGAMYEPLHATISQEDAQKAARAIEERVLPWIEKAFEAGGSGKEWTGEDWITITSFSEFCKENGLTPTEPETDNDPVIKIQPVNEYKIKVESITKVFTSGFPHCVRGGK